MERSASSKKPVQVFRIHGVSASIFENESEINGVTVPFYKVSLQRTYKDGKDFKNTDTLGRDDLLIAAALLQMAWEFVYETEQNLP